MHSCTDPASSSSSSSSIYHHYRFSISGLNGYMLIRADLDTLESPRDQLTERFFQRSVLPEMPWLHYLLPDKRDPSITDRLRHSRNFEGIKSRTVKFLKCLHSIFLNTLFLSLEFVSSCWCFVLYCIGFMCNLHCTLIQLLAATWNKTKSLAYTVLFQQHAARWHSRTVVTALKMKRVFNAAAAALSIATVDKLFTHPFASVIKQCTLVLQCKMGSKQAHHAKH